MSGNTENRPTENHLLNYSLPKVQDEHPLTLHVALRQYALRPHDAHTRREMRAQQHFLRHVPDTELTHYLEAPLPSDAIAMMEVTRPTEVDGHTAEHTVHLAIHVPRRGVQHAVEHLRSQNAQPWNVHPKLARFAHLLASGDAERDPFPDHITDWKTATEAASALLYTHPDLINLSTVDGGHYPAYILDHCVLRALNRSGTLIEYIEDLGDRWMKTEPALGPDGKPLYDKDGKPVFTRIVHGRVQAAMSGPLGLAIKFCKGDEHLRDEQWNVQYGVTTAPYRAMARDADAPHTSMLAADAVAAAGPYKWALANRTPGSGLVVDPNLTYTPAPQQAEFNVSDIWMSTDTGSELSPAVVKDLLAEKIHVTLLNPATPSGLVRATLKVDGAAKPGEAVKFKADFAAVQAGGTASASGTFVLNDLRTALTFSVKAKQLGASPSGTFSAGEKGAEKVLRSFRIVDDSANGTLTLRCTNEWLRHLSACVQFRDENGNALRPAAWSEKIPSFLRPLFQPIDHTKFVELVPPVRTVFGIPIPPDPTTIKIPVPPEARSIQVYFGGLGRGGSYDIAVCPIGTAVTIVAEMALPVILLLAGTAVSNSKAVVSLMADKEVLFAVCTVAGFLVAGGTATYIGISQDPGRAVKDVAITLGPMLLSPATALGQWLLQKVAEGVAQRAVPFFNVFTTVVNGAVTAAQLSQTIIEVASSPWVFNAEITRAIDLEVTLKPDKRYSRFPDQATYYEVSVVYDKGATLPKQTFQLAGKPPRSKDIAVKFADIPAGGRLRAYVFFYAENGWQAGQCQSEWIDAKGTAGSTLKLDLHVTTNTVPLTESSVYQHVSKIAYDEHGKRHYWKPADRSPDEVATSPSPFPHHHVQRRLSITSAQEPAQLAYAWQATGLNQPIDDPTRPPSGASMYTLQNLSSLEDAEEGYATPKAGFTYAAGVFYDLTAESGSGQHYFVDASRGPYDLEKNHAGGMHLRHVTLRKGAKPDFALGTNQSWGRFPFPMDRYVLHPQGVVLGVSYSTHMLWILPLPKAATNDNDAPQATMAGGEGHREGLLDGPRAIAVGLDGRVLVLEGGNHRIQAFDLAGKPVQYFKNPAGGDKISSVQLKDPGDSTYLDLAVEAKGYLYVLRRRGATDGPDAYQVDLYEPDGTHLVSTPRVTADKITVDLLRNMYSLNYETFLGHNERTEPSVSLWIPPAPPV